MLKYAYEIGVKLAYGEMGLTPEQMAAAQNLGAIGGGFAGLSGGALLGKYLGGRAAEAFDLDKNRSRLVGSILGGLAGGAAGGLAGYQVPKALRQTIPTSTAPTSEATPSYDPSESNALQLLPSAYDNGGAYGDTYGAYGLTDNYYPEY